MAILRSYDAELSTVLPQRLSNQFPQEQGLQHARWMILEMLANLEAALRAQHGPHDNIRDQLASLTAFERTLEKGMRWLGFIQAILWYEHIYSVEEMRDHNQPVKGDY